MQYIIFLRAVNVSGKNLIKMAELKEKLSKAGYQDVQTYIQSGNILLKSDESSEKLATQINSLIKNEFGLDISVFVLAEKELRKSLDDCPFSAELAPNHVFITYLDKEPENTVLELFKSIDLSPEEYMHKGKLFYFYLPSGMAKSKLNNNFIEKKLKVIATGRNLNTINKMLTLITK